MARTMRQVAIVFILFALIALSMLSSAYAEEKPPVYAGLGGLMLPPDVLAEVFNRTRLPQNTPDLSVYREFAKKFYKTCNVSIDMVALLIYAIAVHYPGQEPYKVGYALLYDPLTGNLMWAFLNRSTANYYFDWSYQDYYVFSKGFPPMGFYLWYLIVDEYAWRYNHSLVARAWFYRWNATHLKNPYTRYNGYPLDIYCPISDNFTWSMLFKGLPQTVTYTMPVTVTMTYTMPVTITLPVTVTETVTETATTTLPPVTITSTTTATTPVTIGRTVTETVTITTPITVEKTVTREKTLTLVSTTTMSYTATLPATITTTATSTIERWLTTTQIAKELDMASLMIASGLAVAIGIVIGFMVRRR